MTVNGVTLLKDTEYTFIRNKINTTTVFTTSGTTLIPSDTVQMIYLQDPGGTSEGLLVETTLVTSILSGATGDQPAGAKVFYNTTHNKYEYYLDYAPLDPYKIQLQVNGIDLLYPEDYYQSSSQANRLIFDSAIILPTDVIIAYYLPSADKTVELTESLTKKDLRVIWNSSPPPTTIPGDFNVEIAASADTSYSTILYSASTVYVSGQTEYSLTIPITGLNQTYLYRVASHKSYTTITADLLITSSYSQNGSFNTNNNILNTY
jgi:hypothetical protein